MPTVFDSQGRPVTLGKELGKGGEGSVYAATHSTPGEWVAKIYHKPIEREQAIKLASMVHSRSDALLRHTSWPMELLSSSKGGQVNGLLMPYAKGKPIHLLYSPKSRQSEFPTAGWNFLIHTAANVARAVHVIHEHGHVVGDVNQSNFLVSEKATVFLIDCDSFQIAHSGRCFLCEVGVDLYTPPELQGKSFRGITRTKDHDAFGLAVLIFHLLFMGRHPFSGRFLGQGNRELHQNIAEYRFAYSSQATALQIQQPPGTLSLATVTTPLATLFERAFGKDSSRPGFRPTPLEWINALERLGRELRICSNNPAHHFPGALSVCPWCDLESKTKVAFFSYMVVLGKATKPSFDLDSVWAGILSVPFPGKPTSPPTVTSFAYRPTQICIQAGRERRFCMVVASLIVGGSSYGGIFGGLGLQPAIIFFIVVGIILFNVRTKGEVRKETKEQWSHSQTNWTIVSSEWEEKASEKRFSEQRHQLERQYIRYNDLISERQKRLKALETDARTRQLQRYLDQQYIATASIKGFGSSRKATLRSYGIETAADITYQAITSVPGFGDAMATTLIQWRQSIEATFIFDPKRAVDARDIAVIEQDIARQLHPVEQFLTEGRAKLQQIHSQIIEDRKRLRPKLEDSARILAQAEANYKAL